MSNMRYASPKKSGKGGKGFFVALGVCLIAAGTLFLLARFLPGLPWLVIWQVLPARGSSCWGVKCSTFPPDPANAGATSAL